jgi:hypothetical protein
MPRKLRAAKPRDRAVSWIEPQQPPLRGAACTSWVIRVASICVGRKRIGNSGEAMA